ncbi:hypothetical protein AB0E00_20585, partial [Streptomyces sp. NPDC048110]
MRDIHTDVTRACLRPLSAPSPPPLRPPHARQRCLRFREARAYDPPRPRTVTVDGARVACWESGPRDAEPV